ncbi:MAG: tRNA uridine-5-carboxymethylaminomethyl(34) synthesis GTPase MnmE [Arsenophonus sp.]|nr:MAG: tRNA uridine-5-carboxymethylaminomethyl(34) synthesis GTPase MnmE [Arsenophonus sp.]
MYDKQEDTIVAQATPYGKGGIGILRISGKEIFQIFKKILKKHIKKRYAYYLPFYDLKGNLIDKGIAIYFSAPNSFTGENVLELHGHGGQISLNLLLRNILLIKNIRIAYPGEFSYRSFLNNKMDLIQLESVADLINSNSITASNMAIKSLEGLFSKKIHYLINEIQNIRVNIEASLNFPDENINELSFLKIKNKINNIKDDIKYIIKQANQGKKISEGIKIVIIGKPNVGKSSILNALCNQKRAIVTNIPGTTRDILSESIQIDNISLNLIDTAGIRKNFENEIEKIGIQLTYEEIKKADHILYVLDAKKNKNSDINKICYKFQKKIAKNIPFTIILNKIDLLVGDKTKIYNIKNIDIIKLSIHQNKGINLLKNYLYKKFKDNISTETVFLARQRHIKNMIIAFNQLNKIKKLLLDSNTHELILEELSLAQKKLEEIIGISYSKNILNDIFSTFCIGK